MSDGTTPPWDERVPERLVRDIDLANVAEALGDASGDTAWWYDPATGEVEPYSPYGDDFDDDDEDEDSPFDRGLIRIECEGSRPAYRDMERFAEAVGDRHAADQLSRALGGRGAFRRFRDALAELPDDLGSLWRDFVGAAVEARAIAWLVDEGCVRPEDASAELAAREAIIAEVLEALRSTGGLEVDLDDLSTRLRDVTDAVEAGNAVTVTRRPEVGDDHAVEPRSVDRLTRAVSAVRPCRCASAVRPP